MARTRTINIVYKVDRKQIVAAEAETSRIKRSTDNLNKSINQTETAGVKAFGAIKNAIIGSAIVSVIGSLSKKIFELGVAQEQLNISFTTFLGSATKAKALIADLTKFSIVTPFTPEQVNKAAKSLLAFGIEANKIIPTLKILGDVSAGTGKDLGEMAIIFGQIRSTGRLMGQDLLQLINAGFNPLQQISVKTGIAVADLKKKMEQGAISFEMVEQAFIDATSAGGLFFNLMEKQSASVGGKLSTVQGNIEEIEKALFEANSGPVADFADALVKITSNIDGVTRAVNYLLSVLKVNPFTLMFKEAALFLGLFQDDPAKAGPKQSEKNPGFRQAQKEGFNKTNSVFDSLFSDTSKKKKPTKAEVEETIRATVEEQVLYDVQQRVTEARIKFNELYKDILEDGAKDFAEVISDGYDLEFQALVTKNERELQAQESHQERIKQLKRDAFNYGVELLGQALMATIHTDTVEEELIRNKYDRELSLANNNEESIKIIRERQDREIEIARIKQAKQDREVAIKQMAIQNLLNSLRALGTPPVPNFGAAGLALAFGFTQIGLAKAFGFKDGVIDLKGPGTKTSDSIPAFLSRGESVMTADETSSSKGLLQMIRAKKLDDKVISKLSSKQAITAFTDSRIVDELRNNRASIERNKTDLARQGATLYEWHQVSGSLRRKVKSKIISR